MRLIDADELQDRVTMFALSINDYVIDSNGVGAWACANVGSMIDNAPTVEPKHGHWVELYEENYKCSNCGAWWTMIEGTPKDNDMDYCPTCGAKMDEVEDEID